MNWIDAENGEQIRKDAIIGVGKVRAVKTSSGKGEKMVEKTVYNFTIRLGTGGVVIKSPDYQDQHTADHARAVALA